MDPQRNARQGFSEGWLSSLGVHRRWRKRGVAAALICAAMECFRAAGLEYAALGVDTSYGQWPLRSTRRRLRA